MSRSRHFLPGAAAGSHRRIAVPFLCLALGSLVAVSGCGRDMETRLAEIRAFQDAGRFGDSVEPLRALVAEDPDLAEANYRLGVALIQTRQPSLAIWPLEKAARSSEFAIPSGLLLASTLLTTKNFEDAKHAADRVLELDPERTAALVLRAWANQGAGDNPAALQDVDRLLEVTPEDFKANLMRAVLLTDLDRLEEAEQAYAHLREVTRDSDQPGVEARAWLAMARFYQDAMEDPERAEVEYRACLEAFPRDSFTLRMTTEFFDKVGKPEVATEIIRNLVQELPDNLSARVGLAARLRRAGRVEEAEALLVEAAENLDTAQAWGELASFYREIEEPAKAVPALEKASERMEGAPNDEILFVRADLYVEVGDYERAEEMRAQLESETYRNLVEGRILLARGDASGALAALDRGIRRWPNNAGARHLAGLAALELGDHERAASEFREAVRVDAGATDAGIYLARLLLARGDAEQARLFARQYLARRSNEQAHAHVTYIRAELAVGNYAEARAGAAELEKATGDRVLATSELARVERQENGPEASLRVVRESGLDLTDAEAEPALRSLTEDLIVLGRGAEARRRVDAALARNPESISLLELKGSMLALLDQPEQARATYEEALALGGDDARLLVRMASLETQAGDLEGALELYDRAAEFDEEGAADAAYRAAQLVLASGNFQEAERRLRSVVKKHPGHAGARNDLAWILAEQGRELAEAERLARRAVEIDRNPDNLDTLGWVLFKRSEYAEAVEHFTAALEARPEAASTRYRLGLALAQTGDVEQARQALSHALSDGAFPEAEQAKRELARLGEG